MSEQTSPLDGPLISPLTGEPIQNEQLSELAELANEALMAQKHIEELTVTMEQITSKYRALTEERIPGLMDQIGLASIKLKSGIKLEIKQFYNASIPAENQEEAFKWLDTNGHGGLIKTEVKETFGRGQQEKVEALLQILEDNNVVFTRKDGVHPQTLKAFVKEQFEEGKPLPSDLFNVYIGKRAKFTV